MKNSLSTKDIKNWVGDVLIYNLLPVVIVFLTNLQTGNFQTALGASYVALIAALINLAQKYKSGIDSVEETQVVTQLPADVQQPDPTQTAK